MYSTYIRVKSDKHTGADKMTNKEKTQARINHLLTTYKLSIETEEDRKNYEMASTHYRTWQNWDCWQHTAQRFAKSCQTLAGKLHRRWGLNSPRLSGPTDHTRYGVRL